MHSKKLSRKVLTFFFAVLLLLATVSTVAGATSETEIIKFPDETSETTVAYGNQNYAYNTVTLQAALIGNNAEPTGALVIPASVSIMQLQYTVVELRDNVFFNCTQLDSVTVPSGVTKIGNKAFSGCTALTAVTLPPSVTIIADNAFYNSPNCIIYGGADSFAETYADDHSIQFVEVPVDRIEVTALPGKTIYIQNHDTLDVTGGKITVYYINDTSSEIDLTLDMVSGFDNTVLGFQNITVTYGNKVDTFQIEITNVLLGDVNGDAAVDSDDAIHLLYHTLFPEDSSYDISQSCDFNGSGAVDSDDAIHLLYHTLFTDDDTYALH